MASPRGQCWVLNCLFYINDICHISNILKLALFADNTNMFCSGKNLQELLGCITEEMCKLKRWFNGN